jgi:hypothetical protein
MVSFMLRLSSPLEKLPLDRRLRVGLRAILYITDEEGPLFMPARDQTLAIQFVASYLTDTYPYNFLSK